MMLDQVLRDLEVFDARLDAEPLEDLPRLLARRLALISRLRTIPLTGARPEHVRRLSTISSHTRLLSERFSKSRETARNELRCLGASRRLLESLLDVSADTPVRIDCLG